MRKILPTLLLLFAFKVFFAQGISVPLIDKETYNQYLNKDWKGLIKTEKKASKNGIDFYYLQFRTGIAYYELTKYSKAIKYFEKIYSVNPKDEKISEYLYYSYLFSGRFDDARLLAVSFNKKLKEKLQIETEYPFIHALYSATKQEINNNYEYIPQNYETVQQEIVLKESWYNLSLEHFACKKFTFFHGYSRLNIEHKILNSDFNSDLPPVYSEFINQNEYYILTKYHTAKGLNISGGFHFIHTNYFAPSPLKNPFGRKQMNSVLYNINEKSFVGSLSINKYFSIFNTNFEISVSDLNKKIQIQPSLSLRIFPFANNQFYTDTKFIYLTEKDNTVFNFYTVYRQTFGFKFLKYSLINTSITYGDMKNFTSCDAFIVNNDLDLTKLNAEAFINIGLAKGRFNIFFNYQYNLKENTFTVNHIEQNINYTNQAITTGIKWYFKKY